MAQRGQQGTGGPARGVRARAREQVLGEIIALAEEQLRHRGASELSLRAIARDLGMVSSAIYRYFPSADALLTTLILRAYQDLASSAQTALERSADRSSTGKFLAVCHGCRDWALANPQRYALIYGSPVPGYAAPQDTIEPASRVAAMLIEIISTGEPTEVFEPTESWQQERTALQAQLSAFFGRTVDGDQIGLGVAAWNQLFGLLNFELFGHFVGSVTNNRSYFDAVMRHWARILGLD